MKRVGLFGGSFDPVHNAHVALATLALAQLQLDEVRWIPVCKSSQKSRKLAPAADREAMVRLAIAGEPRFALDRTELRRGGVSYTLDTVRDLAAAIELVAAAARVRVEHEKRAVLRREPHERRDEGDVLRHVGEVAGVEGVPVLHASPSQSRGRSQSRASASSGDPAGGV